MAAVQKVMTCFWFDHNAEDALNFYRSVFPGSEIVSRMMLPASPGGKPQLLAATFRLFGVEYMLLNGGPHYQLNEAASIVVRCDSQHEIDDLWARLLADGGAESRCGWLKDRFGLSWQIVPRDIGDLVAGPDAAGRKRAMDALLTMVKLDIAALRKAYAGN